MREDFELEKEVHEKVIQKFERMVSLTDDYSEIDLQVILEALHIYDSAYQALLNTYAIRWFLKEVDKQGNLPENRLIELQNNFKRKIDLFGEVIDKLDEKLIERDDQGT